MGRVIAFDERPAGPDDHGRVTLGKTGPALIPEAVEADRLTGLADHFQAAHVVHRRFQIVTHLGPVWLPCFLPRRGELPGHVPAKHEVGMSRGTDALRFCDGQIGHCRRSYPRSPLPRPGLASMRRSARPSVGPVRLSTDSSRRDGRLFGLPLFRLFGLLGVPFRLLVRDRGFLRAVPVRPRPSGTAQSLRSGTPTGQMRVEHPWASLAASSPTLSGSSCGTAARNPAGVGTTSDLWSINHGGLLSRHFLIAAPFTPVADGNNDSPLPLSFSGSGDCNTRTTACRLTSSISPGVGPFAFFATTSLLGSCNAGTVRIRVHLVLVDEGS